MDALNSSADEPPWFDRRWRRRISIRQNHKMISGVEDLVDFPMYFEWTSTTPADAQFSGSDFLFRKTQYRCSSRNTE